VEARHCLSALDCLDEPRLRRTALHLLSAAFLDSRRRPQPGPSRDVDPSCVYRSGADLRGLLGILATPPARQRTRGHPRRRLLRHKSQCAPAYLHPQRLCRAARLRHLPPFASGRPPPRQSPRPTFTQIFRLRLFGSPTPPPVSSPAIPWLLYSLGRRSLSARGRWLFALFAGSCWVLA
jgi:hypothetical protein